MTSAEYVAKRLCEERIEYVFGYQGGSVTDIIAAICKLQGLEYIQAYNEQAAAFEANAYARIRNEVGVCVVTNGPGLTNAVSAIADAYCDFVPLLVISGQVETVDRNTDAEIRQNGFQEIDSIGLVSPITKYAHTIESVNELPVELEKAINIAKKPPYGPVLLDIPIDIQKAEIINLVEYKDETVEAYFSFELDDVIIAMQEAKKPIIVAGGGIRQGRAEHEFYEFVKIVGIPVVRTLAGLDLISDHDVGFSGLYGEVCSNLAVYNSDLLIVLGCRLSKKQVGIPDILYGANAKIIHVDINKAELGRTKNEVISINADIKVFLTEILDRLIREEIKFNYKEWINSVELYKKQHESDTETNMSLELRPYSALKKISSLLVDSTTITLDVGQNQMWCAQGLRPKNRQRIICSGGLGCMGFSLPAAIGAYYATHKVVYAFMGDGGFQMNIQELQFVSVTRIPIKIVVLNNKGLGMIQEVQMKFSNQEYYGSKIGYAPPDLQGLALLYNLQYVEINSDEDIDGAALKKTLSNDLPSIVEFKLEGDPLRLLIMYDNLDAYK